MADLIHDANYKVAFLSTLTSTSAPTAAQLTAGTQLDPRMTPSGLTRDATTATVDTSKINSTFTTMAVGRRAFSISVTIVREATDAGGVEAALVYQASGWLCVRDNIAGSGAWAAANKLEVYPVQVGAASKAAPAANELQTITYTFTMTADAVLNAVAA